LPLALEPVKSHIQPFYGVNRLFKPNDQVLEAAYYQNYCIDYHPISHNTKDHQVLIVGGPNTRPTNPK